jgi:hypothetical protein
MSCAAYVNANKIPTFTFTGKPTGGSGEYTYALWNSSGKLANIPSSEVPGSWKYDHQLGSSTDSYIVVTSGTTTANVLCGYSSYAINLTSTQVATTSPSVLGTPFAFKVKPAQQTPDSLSVKLSFTCPVGVTIPVGTIDACTSPVTMSRGDNKYSYTALIKNISGTAQVVGATAQAINKNGDIVATDKDAVSVPPTATIPPSIPFPIVTNTSATVGSAIVQANTTAGYNVSFGFTIDASQSNSNFYLNRSNGVSVTISGSSTPVANQVSAVVPATTDTEAYYVIPAGTSRSFTDSTALYRTTPGLYTMQISQIKYGISSASTTSYSLQVPTTLKVAVTI